MRICRAFHGHIATKPFSVGPYGRFRTSQLLASLPDIICARTDPSPTCAVQRIRDLALPSRTVQDHDARQVVVINGMLEQRKGIG